jgi:hypothetical protein
MIRTHLAALMLLAACAATPAPQPGAASPSMPPEVPRPATPVEIMGDYAGRMMKLTIDGRVVQDGRADARPAGARWLEQVAPGSSPADLILELEGCAVYRAQIFRTGGLQAVSINGCNVMLIG